MHLDGGAVGLKVEVFFEAERVNGLEPLCSARVDRAI